MKVFKILSFMSLMTCAFHAQAWETDQYVTPEEPLQDVMDEVNQKLYGHLVKAVTRINKEIDHYKAWKWDSAVKERQTPHFITYAFYLEFGSGVPANALENWLNSTKFQKQPARFKPHLLLSPTINVNGVYQGTDKLGHVTHEGWDYYNKVRDAGGYAQNPITLELIPTDRHSAALEKAIAWGVETENGVFGMGWTGTYSNADLAANLAGLKFYENVTGPVTLGTEKYEPMLQLQDGHWVINKDSVAQEMLKPFVTEHFNESLNPNFYGKSARSGQINLVKKNCDRWAQFYGRKVGLKTDKQSLDERFKANQTWYGMNYGYNAGTSDNPLITISSVCF